MSIVGIVAEYNPFHNGHLYNLNKAKEITGSDMSVCIMSSNFTQRGIPAIVDKWARTEMALASGIDLVIELPTAFSSQSAQYFSRAAVKLLDALGVIDYICFGSECGDIQPLMETAQILSQEPEEYKSLLKTQLEKGVSFPAARASALSEYTKSTNLNEIITEPNNILGIEYLIALNELKSSLVPVTLQRIEAHYNSTNIEGNIASATAIRHHIENLLDEENIKNTIPSYNYNILQACFKEGRGPVTLSSFEKEIFYKLITLQPEGLTSIFEINEGLQNKIYKAYFEVSTLEEIIDKVKSKRYTYTRIQRIIVNVLIGMTKDFFASYKRSGPAYIRILGFNKNGRAILSKARKKSSLPIISNFSDIYKYDSKDMHSIADFEALSSNIYYSAYKNSEIKSTFQEHKKRVLIYDK